MTIVPLQRCCYVLPAAVKPRVELPKARQSTREPFVEVDYEDKIVFTPKHNGQARPALHLAAESGTWTNHPVFHGMPIRDVIVWLRGEDSDL